MKPTLLLLSPLPADLNERLAAHFNCHQRSQLDEQGTSALAPVVRGIIATGESVLTREEIARWPALEIIAVLGVGYDGIDLGAARDHGVRVTHTPGVSNEDIADLAMALLLCATRQLLPADRFVRQGRWTAGRYPLTRRVSGGRLGIVGMGRIGRAVAARAEAFGMSIAYTGRTPKTDVPYRWYDDLQALASDVDFLVVCAKGGPETDGLVNAAVLNALGPSGVLVNIARGSLIDEHALVSALRDGRLLAAGLDVFRNEPNIPADLLEMPNVVLTPHMASTTEATVRAMADLLFDNLAAHFAGQPVLTPVG
ncbi:2-hydroxyacid dehydrogenase [Stutzerimonas balearica]|uniref:2-hydroxyacid dehydrogenase n=1 Tax=Stutzerimonas balearica TaxID=74829 RepID=UPI00190ADAF7|nr:2-hydroxyacid dehydrogenase [Stutzerimonas balearica]MBK3748374.1 2-hydroxyacid dehydrogenase [Stutzerimonas balearica]MBK3826571.1 2-hydroxyacid dehydrogenase [Stutzerimonas balearica]MBK3856261.1 2-hydroxyacid dehydrogenase [Stutzerimonas balearica]